MSLMVTNRLVRAGILLAAGAASAFGQSEASILLGKIRARMGENLTRLPNYTCGETIERTDKGPKARKANPVDTVRLEVALVDGRELFGWPGSNRIASSDLSTLVGGTVGNGDFALHARSIFLSRGPSFIPKGSAEVDGEAAIQYDYRVSLRSSGYRIKVGANESTVAYHGSIWVRPDTLDLIRLELVADELPEILGLRLVTNRLEYQRVKIGGGEFLLPRGSDMTMTESNGTEHRNVTRFKNCRQYSGESVLTFTDPDTIAPTAAPVEVRAVELPGDFTAAMSLITPIDSEKSAVGDELELRLDANIRSGRTVIAPKGATVTGRISLLQRSGRIYALQIALESIGFEGGRASLEGRDNTVMMVAPSTPGSRVGRGYGGVPGQAGVQPLLFETGRLRLSKGFLLQVHSQLLKSEKR